MEITETQFNLLYSVYSLPNIIVPFFGGYLLDKFGSRKLILILSAILFLGQLSNINFHNLLLIQ